MAEIGRLLTAMVTPFDKNQEVDYQTAGALARSLVRSGSDGIVVSGTTGSSATLMDEEKIRLFQRVGGNLDNKDLVVCGTGSNNTWHAITLTQKAWRVGFNHFLLVTPYYNKTSQEGLYQHFKAILSVFPQASFIIYCVSGRTSQRTDPATVARLARDFPNLVGMKAADGVEHARETWKLLRKDRPDFLFWSGDDAATFQIMSDGYGYGLIGVDAHLFAEERQKQIQWHVDAQVSANPSTKRLILDKARAVHFALEELDRALMNPDVPNPIPIRFLVNELVMGIGTDRLPQVELDEILRPGLLELYEATRERLKKIRDWS